MINRKTLKFCVLLALSLFLAYNVVTVDRPFSLVSYLKNDNRFNLLQNAIKDNSNNPDIFYQLANKKDILFESDENEINLLYLNTLKNNPLHVFSMIKLADLSIESGNNSEALEILKWANKYSKMSADRLWELSFIAYKLQQQVIFYKSLYTVANIDRDRKEHVYKLALKLVEDREDILKYIVSEKIYYNYFSYIMRVSDPEHAQLVYNYALDNNIDINEDAKLQYTEYLINKGFGIAAHNVWKSLYGEYKGLVWNSGFEDRILNTGFGWKIDNKYDYNYETQTEYETRRPLRGKRSLKISFLNKNIDYKNITQSIPVTPNTSYIFSSILSTKDITSDNGVGWEISCIPGADFYTQTDYLLGNNTEKVLFSRFKTPDNCNIIKINFRRKKSDKFNKYISGEVLIDDVLLNALKKN